MTNDKNKNDQQSQKENEANSYDDLSYEEARDKLMQIVADLDSGDKSLEESLDLWQQGEELATHCEKLLAGAQKKLDEAIQERTES